MADSSDTRTEGTDPSENPRKRKPRRASKRQTRLIARLGRDGKPTDQELLTLQSLCDEFHAAIGAPAPQDQASHWLRMALFSRDQIQQLDARIERARSVPFAPGDVPLDVLLEHRRSELSFHRMELQLARGFAKKQGQEPTSLLEMTQQAEERDRDSGESEDQV